jgi:hypothetical protein
MRKHIFVTEVLGNTIQARTRDEATEEFLRRGTFHTDFQEVR